MVKVVRSSSAELRASLNKQRKEGRKIGFIPTMGFLHEGHLSLIRASASKSEYPVVSIFVNPTQFGPNEDLESYPRNETHDIELATAAGAELIWIPSESSIYPSPGGMSAQQIKVVPGTIAQRLCGSSRPVFFSGICTVVLKLFNLVQPDSAYFGEKDFQQLQIIRTMVQELHLDIDVVGCPIIRENDGLAMSSRNVRIPADLRHTALHLYQTIQKAKYLVSEGEVNTRLLIKKMLENWPKRLELDYLELRDPRTLDLASKISPDTRVFLGAWLKDDSGSRSVRLIDNANLHRD